jgi:hypothetical protein
MRPHKDGPAKFITPNGYREPTCMMLRHATVQRSVDQADSGMSQLMGIGGMGKVSAIGASHDLEGSIEG